MFNPFYICPLTFNDALSTASVEWEFFDNYEFGMMREEHMLTYPINCFKYWDILRKISGSVSGPRNEIPNRAHVNEEHKCRFLYFRYRSCEKIVVRDLNTEIGWKNIRYSIHLSDLVEFRSSSLMLIFQNKRLPLTAI
jgi:hypothetical protein